MVKRSLGDRDKGASMIDSDVVNISPLLLVIIEFNMIVSQY